ncbi:transposase [Bacillus infantis]|uniref:transposase n=1 Tax=Bacillus infantis TaxID=324767 RepID=UPI0021CCFA04|nr:transposase [Bacillus infantis]
MKGHSYGTLICDLETNTAIDILPDRLQETLTGWLQRYPHVQVVSRDGYQAFRRAIREADPSILQVYDRFHYVQNLYKHLENHLLSKIPSQIVWKRESQKKPSIPMTKQEERQLEGRKKPFHSYALRLRSDLQVIKNSILLHFSNGLLEGQVNRLKFIKRMMYGRASILILKKRMTYRL